MDFILKITKAFSFVVYTESSATKTAPLYNIQSSQVAELIVLTEACTVIKRQKIR